MSGVRMSEVFPTTCPGQKTLVVADRAMELVCLDCKGKGYTGRIGFDDDINPLWTDCPKCRETGRILTAEGRMLLDFMVRHLRYDGRDNVRRLYTHQGESKNTQQVEITDADDARVDETIQRRD